METKDINYGSNNIEQENSSFVEVDMDRWDQAEEGKILCTYGLTSCTGLLVADLEGRHAFLGHFTSLNSPMTDQMFDSIQNYKKGRDTKLRALFTGASPVTIDDNLGLSEEILNALSDYQKKGQEKIMEQLFGLGLVQKDIQEIWQSKHNEISHLWYDPKYNQGTIETSTYDEVNDSVSEPLMRDFSL